MRSDQTSDAEYQSQDIDVAIASHIGAASDGVANRARAPHVVDACAGTQPAYIDRGATGSLRVDLEYQ